MKDFAPDDPTQRILKRFNDEPFAVMTIAHRGQAGVSQRIFPENSIAAITLAANRGVGVVEVDIRLTADGKYVLSHDPTLDRTTNVREVFPDRAETEGEHKGHYPVNKFTLDEIKQLKLTDGFDGEVHRVPTLQEVLAAAKGKIFIDLDLKEVDLPQLISIIKEYGNDNLLAFHDDPEILKQMLDTTGVIPLPINLPKNEGGDPIADFYRFQEMFGKSFKVMHTTMSDISPELVKLANDNHVRLWINTIDDPDAAAERFDYSLWKGYIGSGANMLQSDMSIELTRFIKLSEACASLPKVGSCKIFSD